MVPAFRSTRIRLARQNAIMLIIWRISSSKFCNISAFNLSVNEIKGFYL